jgi:prepilin-type N-terminal cleavage/methylation domain-containing protein
MHNRSSNGFTIIEILTCLSIVALLASILYPLLPRAKARGKQSVCESNLHQIGLAFGIYAADYDDYLPYAIGRAQRDRPWTVSSHYIGEFKDIPDILVVLSELTKNNNVFRCPSDSTAYSDSDLHLGPFPNYFAYGGSSYLFDEHLGKSLSEISNNPYGSLSFDESPCWHSACPSNVFDAKVNRLFGDLHIGFVP